MRAARQGIEIATTTYDAGTVLGEHYHDGASLSLIFRGGYTERLGSRRHECEPLGFIYKPPRIEHSNHIGSVGLDGLFVEIAHDRFAEVAEVVKSIPDSLCVSSPRTRLLVAQARREVRAELAGYELALEGILLELWAEAARSSIRTTPTVPPWLVRALEYLKAHFRGSMGLTELARAAGVHPVHLAQTFRRIYGQTVGERVRAMRVEFAAHALADREQSIGGIALEAGFADHSHFARTFKSQMGVTPSVYRRALLD